jgi:hypothetical protein
MNRVKPGEAETRRGSDRVFSTAVPFRAEAGMHLSPAIFEALSRDQHFNSYNHWLSSLHRLIASQGVYAMQKYATPLWHAS